MGSALTTLTSKRKALLGTLVLLFVVFELNKIYLDSSFRSIRKHLPSSLYHSDTALNTTALHESVESSENAKPEVHQALPSPPTEEDVVELSAGNSTLGFSRIVSISAKADGRRTEDLIRAAQRTGLDIEVSVAPDWSDEEADDLRKNKQDHMFPLNRGGARAWLSHAHTVREFIASGDPSALIIEGDVDWDLEVKKQMILISENIQQHYHDAHLRQELKKSTIDSPPKRHIVPDVREIDTPYALDEYDVLWVGLLGQTFFASYSAPHNDVLRSFSDDTIPDPSLLHSQNHPLPPPAQAPKTRTIFFPESNPAPCSTFAYAITQKSAPKLLEVLTNPTSTDNAHDVAMRDACRNQRLKCVAVWPEVMHHQKLLGVPGEGSAIIMADEAGRKAKEEEEKKIEGEEEKEKAAEEQDQSDDLIEPDSLTANGIFDSTNDSDEVGGNGEPTSNDLAKRDEKTPVKVTANIRWSARCNSEPGWEERLQQGEPPISCIPKYSEDGWPIGVHD